MSVSSLYSVTVNPGTWLPVIVTVTNLGASTVQGQVVVTSPVLPLSQLSPEMCYINGLSTICSFTGTFYSGTSTLTSPVQSGTVVSYRLPLQLAPGTTKRTATYVLIESPQTSVEAEALDRAGRVLARATSQPSVNDGSFPPAVLLVTDEPGALSTLPLPTPEGSLPEVQVLSPAALPGTSAALAPFSVIAIDQADTSVLSSAQAQALQVYLDAGGTVVVMGGLSWRAAVAGLPRGLLPAEVTGTASARLSQLARLLGSASPQGKVDLDTLEPTGGGAVILSQGRSPIAVEASRGSGQVVFCGVDPAAAPLSTWPGDGRLISRLLAPAYQDSYYGQAGSALSGALPTVPMPTPVSVMSELGPGRTALMSPTVAGSSLAAYLAQIAGADYPSAVLLALLLLGYVVVAGPVCFVVLGRMRRRGLVWVVVPGVAVVSGVVAYSTGAGTVTSPRLVQVQVARFSPGTHLAQVTSLGAVFLPRGGAARVVLDSSGPVTDLGAADGAQLAVEAGEVPGAALLDFNGPTSSLGGWASSRDAPLDGTVDAKVRESVRSLSGTITNQLGTKLTDVYVVSGWGDVAVLRALRPGASTSFSMPASSPNAVPADTFPMTLSIPFLSTESRPGSATSLQQAAIAGLYDLASAYSGTNGTGAILVALTGRPLLAAGAAGTLATSKEMGVIAVPLTPEVQTGTGIAGLEPELVGSSGAVAGTAVGLATSSLVLARGGHFDYQFLLPPGAWRKLRLDLGSLSEATSSSGSVEVPGLGVPPAAGSAAGVAAAHMDDFSLSVYNYTTGSWDRLRASYPSGVVLATVPLAVQHIGPGGAVEVRLSARAKVLEVFGAVPSLSASAASAGGS
jgi:hypothetical protein